MRTSDEIVTQQRIAQAVLATIAGAPQGAPSERLYAVLQQWITPEDFRAMMRLLVATKRIAQQGDLYFPIGDR